eukprot:2141184-Prymnesium_polylepis.1
MCEIRAEALSTAHSQPAVCATHHAGRSTQQQQQHAVRLASRITSRSRCVGAIHALFTDVEHARRPPSFTSSGFCKLSGPGGRLATTTYSKYAKF